MAKLSRSPWLLEHPDGAFSFYWDIDKSDLEDQLAKHAVVKTDILPEHVLLYRLADSTILYSDDPQFYLFETPLDFQVFEATRWQGQSVMLNKNPLGESFPDLIDPEIRNLLLQFTLELPADSDYLSLLQTIESLIAGLENPYKFYRENFVAFVGLIGKSIITNNGGSWLMELETDGRTWLPFIARGTKKIPFFIDVYEEIFINHNLRTPLSTLCPYF